MLYPIELLGQERATMVAITGRFVMPPLTPARFAVTSTALPFELIVLQFRQYVGKLTSIKTVT